MVNALKSQALIYENVGFNFRLRLPLEANSLPISPSRGLAVTDSQVPRSINRLPAAVDTELLVDIDRVSFDCFGRDENLLRDLFVTHPLCQ